MQPRELVVTGLTSFSERVVIDFTDARLFALVGPTGAGKSSVVDAITLALYGRIPRLHANEIAPLISTSASECTVALTFTVRGRPHRAVRTIRRTKTGASTLEAALEQLDDDGAPAATLAGTADDVTAEVEALLGLSFDEFTRAVVLPQGEFARVLKAKTSERQNLLARLLGTGIYDRVKQRAGAHGRAAQERAEQTAHQIAQLGAVDQRQIAAIDQRVTDLDALIERLTADTASLLDVRERYRDATDAAKAAAEVVSRLDGVPPPPEEAGAVAERIAQADALVEKRRATAADADRDLAAAEDAVADPDEVEQLGRTIAAHERTAELQQAVADAEGSPALAEDRIGPLEAALVTARTAVEAARVAQGRVHREHAAAQAVAGLDVGDDCPVCAASLGPDAPALAAQGEAAATAVADASDAVTAAVQHAATTEAQLGRARAERTAAVEARDRAADRLRAHLTALEGQPTLADATARRDAARQQQTRIAALRRDARQARDDLEAATAARTRLDEQVRGLADRLDRLRLTVAELTPPATSGEVVADWQALRDWAQAALPSARESAAVAAAAVDAVQQEGVRLRGQMEQACRDAEVPDGTGDPRDRAVQARADAAAEAGRLRTVAEMVTRLRAEEEDAREHAVVGAELARLLRADQFQKWLLDEATRALVAAASAQLLTLSRGRYELRLDGRGAIHVADLASAGSLRSVRTLSGGETFLASLALALGLAEQIAFAASGPVALESLFIDEGFGALDPETLDVAAEAIEQLGAGDRTVGVITHVAEMADRLPTRFQVQRTAGGSRVERVDL